jgi:hypothetical protein
MTVSVCMYLYLSLSLGRLALSFRVAGSGNVDPTNAVFLSSFASRVVGLG